MALPASEVPHSPQNLNGGEFSAPHFGHRIVNALPHSPQNFFPAGFSVPHFEQRIAFYLGGMLASFVSSGAHDEPARLRKNDRSTLLVIINQGS